MTDPTPDPAPEPETCDWCTRESPARGRRHCDQCYRMATRSPLSVKAKRLLFDAHDSETGLRPGQVLLSKCREAAARGLHQRCLGRYDTTTKGLFDQKRIPGTPAYFSLNEMGRRWCEESTPFDRRVRDSRVLTSDAELVELSLALARAIVRDPTGVAGTVLNAARALLEAHEERNA